jgi:hypothetical protein
MDLERLTHLLPSLRNCSESRREAEQMMPALSAPADPAWMMARIAALLSPYYEKDTPQGVRVMEAQDWAAELKGLPQWAIERAVRWWKGGDNPKRAKRPLEGDISARAKFEMQAVRAARIAMKSSEPVPARPAPVTERATPEAREAIMREVGFDPTAGGQLHKRMPGSLPREAAE